MWNIRKDNEDITGKIFGKLTAQKRTYRNEFKSEYWECICDCGGTKTVRKSHLKSGNVKSCGCLNGYHDITGKKYGKLTPIRIADKYKPGKLAWLCLCSCGKEVIVEAWSLKSMNTQSCGCLRTNNSGNRTKKSDRDREFYNSLTSLKRGAKSRGFEWVLSDDICKNIMIENCEYCGSNPDRGKHFKHHVIDRKDSSLGYIVSNVVACCTICNRMKSNYSIDNFLKHIDKISSHQRR